MVRKCLNVCRIWLTTSCGFPPAEDTKILELKLELSQVGRAAHRISFTHISKQDCSKRNGLYWVNLCDMKLVMCYCIYTKLEKNLIWKSMQTSGAIQASRPGVTPMLRQSDDMNILKSFESSRLTAITRLRKPVPSPLITSIICSHYHRVSSRAWHCMHYRLVHASHAWYSI